MFADPEKDHRICFVGDSFVQGTGDQLCIGWAGRVAAKAQHAGFDITHYNLGIRRDTSRDILIRWEKECAIRLPPDVLHYVVFSLGVNDAAIENGTRRISVAESADNFQQLISQSSGLYATLVIGPPPVDDLDHNHRIKELSHLYKKLAHEIGVPYLPVFEPLLADTDWTTDLRTNDGYHPGDLGYTKLAELISTWQKWWFRSSGSP